MRRTLFRYRSFNTDKLNDYRYIHQRIINIEKWKFEAFEGLVYPSSPLYFNDPYDCEFCFQSDALEGVLDRETYIHLLERRFSLKQEEKNRILYSDNIERAMQIVLQAHGGRLSDSWMNILQNGLNDCMSTIKDAVRVVCLSEVYDSMLMWSHYAQNHTGFCIEYDFKESDMLCKQLYPVIYVFPKGLRIKSVYSTDETVKSTGIKFPPYGNMVSYELYYNDRRIFRVKGKNSPYIGYTMILEALQDRLSMDTQIIEQSDNYTVINESFSNDFNAISEYKFLLAPVEHTAYDGEEKYTAHTYIENAKADANLLKMHFQLGHVRGMMQYLADNGVEIMYIRNNLIYKLNPQ